jgi:SSS family solute:Na+ symporter
MGGAMEGQRILSSRNPRHAVVMYVVTAVTMFTLVLLVSLPCMGAAVLWPYLRDPGADRELAYGLLMQKMLPVGVMGIVAAGMLAGVMSTVGDNLNFGSQVMLNDLYRRWIRRDAPERHYLVVGKLCMVVILALAIIIVYRAQFIFNVAVFMLQFSAAELPANWAQWWWWRFNGKARLAASFGGGAIFCLVVLGPLLLDRMGMSWARALIIPWWYQTFVVMGLTTLLWVSIALMTRPDPEPVLANFYFRAHPMGWWEPIRRIRQGTEDAESAGGGAGWNPIWHGFGIAGLGAASVMCYILALSNLTVGSVLAASLYLAAGVILMLIFIRLLPPYLDTLEAA